MQTACETLGYSDGDEGVLEAKCPDEIIDTFGEHIGIARWLYSSALTAPHHHNEWRSWYLSRIIQREGWTLLDAMNDAMKLPDGTKCPAFALAARVTEVSNECLIMSMSCTFMAITILLDPLFILVVSDGVN